ncbi:penicillin-insensitive murein endopeptidase [Polyangium sp. y55x31]|uniref:penicillin-insensitive murein endopeptidase n=1 Tax=Polyangium sp. y55x31 TaxID=3042688 RepID=UPI002482CEE3|nr:penicillin-insensitive murein endopeptidase [Polyangium sp. y55x31]MDI1480062.1 penicillin-insensitive murein endopeptidase [Polyangium sp. y55x31]
MYRLTGSVGQGGRNAHDDVVLVQKQLNKNAHIASAIGTLPETGIMDEATLRAILSFQRSVVRLGSPDGRVDPHGRTWRMLLGDQPQATNVAFVQLSGENGNFYLYEPQDRVWGTPATIQSIKNVAAVLKPHGFEIGIGDISFQQGGKMAPHGSHRRGTDVDIRPVRGDGRRAPVTITDPNYNHARTKLLVEALRAEPNLKLILFNDSKMPGVRPWEGHHNHLHVRFEE